MVSLINHDDNFLYNPCHNFSEFVMNSYTDLQVTVYLWILNLLRQEILIFLRPFEILPEGMYSVKAYNGYFRSRVSIFSKIFPSKEVKSVFLHSQPNHPNPFHQ